LEIFSKDHQWAAGDGRAQQKIGIGTGNMNTASPAWPTSSPVNAPFSGVGRMSTIHSIAVAIRSQCVNSSTKKKIILSA
jgi:hypothetical protein